jgi:hypothetical protein
MDLLSCNPLYAMRMGLPECKEQPANNSGLFIGPTHRVQLDTPVKNVLALVDAVRDTPYTAG